MEENSANLNGLVSYRGYTILQLTLGSWVVAALTGIHFLTLSDAKRRIDRECDANDGKIPTRAKLPHGDSL